MHTKTYGFSTNQLLIAVLLIIITVIVIIIIAETHLYNVTDPISH